MRVTLWKCKWCGAVAAKRESQIIVLVGGDAARNCTNGGREVHDPEPIEFAPLPSEETRDITREALRFARKNSDYLYAWADEVEAALTELEEAWKS